MLKQIGNTLIQCDLGFNVGCLEGINPYDLGEVPVADGGPWQSP
jgi:hypothetical protein